MEHIMIQAMPGPFWPWGRVVVPSIPTMIPTNERNRFKNASHEKQGIQPMRKKIRQRVPNIMQAIFM